MADDTGKKPDFMSIQVRVFRHQRGVPQRVYRQIWSGKPMAVFNVKAKGQQPCQIYLLRSREDRSFVALRLPKNGKSDFSIDQFTHDWPLAIYLLDQGVEAEQLASLNLPLPLTAALNQSNKMIKILRQHTMRRKLTGPSRLVAPFFTGEARAISTPVDGAFRLEMQALSLNQGSVSSVFNTELRTRAFFALPVTGMKFANFDVQYLLTDDKNKPQVVHSACRDGYTSFGLTTCKNEKRAVALLARRGVTAQMAIGVGLEVPSAQLEREKIADEQIARIADRAKVTSGPR